MWRVGPGLSTLRGLQGKNESRSEGMDVMKDIEDIRGSLRILDEKVGEITRSIRAYVDFQTEKRVEEGFEEFEDRLGRRISGLESRIDVLEAHAKAKSIP